MVLHNVPNTKYKIHHLRYKYKILMDPQIENTIYTISKIKYKLHHPKYKIPKYTISNTNRYKNGKEEKEELTDPLPVLHKCSVPITRYQIPNTNTKYNANTIHLQIQIQNGEEEGVELETKYKYKIQIQYKCK